MPKLGWCWAGNPHTWLGTAFARHADRARLQSRGERAHRLRLVGEPDEPGPARAPPHVHGPTDHRPPVPVAAVGGQCEEIAVEVAVGGEGGAVAGEHEAGDVAARAEEHGVGQGKGARVARPGACAGRPGPVGHPAVDGRRSSGDRTCPRSRRSPRRTRRRRVGARAGVAEEDGAGRRLGGYFRPAFWSPAQRAHVGNVLGVLTLSGRAVRSCQAATTLYNGAPRRDVPGGECVPSRTKTGPTRREPG